MLRAVPLLTIVLLSSPGAAAEPVRVEWTVEGVRREALVYAPSSAREKSTPVVFAFHGHGGTMRNATRQFAFFTLWPDAISVYMQGLPTPGRLTDPEGKKNGWQPGQGEQGDRDLKFFDAVLATLRKDYRVDDTRIYATGHSNGGSFTYLLWATRGDVFAAVAPSAAVAGRVVSDLKPKPVLHVVGENDPLVKFTWQKAMIERLKSVNGCAGAPKSLGKLTTEYPSSGGTPVVVYMHPGDHGYPREVMPIIVSFFRDHPKSVAKP